MARSPQKSGEDVNARVKTIQNLSFPEDSLDPDFIGALWNICRVHGINARLAFGPLLSITSYLLGNKTSIRIWKGYTTRALLWSMTGSFPGGGKGDVIKFLKNALSLVEFPKDNSSSPKKEDNREEEEPSSQGDESELNRCSLEDLVYKLEDSSNSSFLALYEDFAILRKHCDEFGRMESCTLLKQLYEGKAVDVQEKGLDIYIESTNLAISGFASPDIMIDVLRNRKEFSNLFIMEIPKREVLTVKQRKDLKEQLKADEVLKEEPEIFFGKIFSRIYNFFGQSTGDIEIACSPEAQDLFSELEGHLHSIMEDKSGQEDFEIRWALDLTARLSGIICVLEEAFLNRSFSKIITSTQMSGAIDLVRYFIKIQNILRKGIPSSA